MFTMSDGGGLPDDYQQTLDTVTAWIGAASYRAQRVVNTQRNELYWRFGALILDRQHRGTGWGAFVIRRLASDLRRDLPDAKGYSESNLNYMRAFAAAWPGRAEGNFSQQLAEKSLPQVAGGAWDEVVTPVGDLDIGRLPWGHIMVLLDKLDTRQARDWYAAEAVAHGWSRNVLLSMILNRTLEQALLDWIADTLRELGVGFAFVGRQVHFEVDGDDFYLDLLFFHVTQLRYIVIELKAGPFKPEHLGQLAFYMQLVDRDLKADIHAPTVGILICGDKKEKVVRYALDANAAPMAVSGYTYASLPPEQRASLPSEDQLAVALGGSLGAAPTPKDPA